MFIGYSNSVIAKLGLLLLTLILMVSPDKHLVDQSSVCQSGSLATWRAPKATAYQDTNRARLRNFKMV